MNLLKKNPAITVGALLLVVVLAVFGWLYATDSDREPASAQSTVAAVAPSVAAPTAAAPTTAPAEDPAASAAPDEASTAPSDEPTVEPSALPTFAAGSDHAQAPEAGDWREPAEAFAAAYADSHGGDQEAWLAGMEPYVTDTMLENFSYTHMANVIDDEVEAVESVQIESTTMSFKVHYAEAGDDTIGLMELQPSGEWKVAALGLTAADVE